MGIEEQYTPGEIAKMHDSANAKRFDPLAYALERAQADRDEWKKRAEVAEARVKELEQKQ